MILNVTADDVMLILTDDSFELLVFNRDHQEEGDLDMHHVSGVRHPVPDSNVATASGGMELHASTTAQNTDNTTGEDTRSVVKESSVIVSHYEIACRK